MRTLHAFFTILACLTLTLPATARQSSDDGAAGPAPRSGVARTGETGAEDVDLELGGRLHLDASIPVEERPFGGAFGELETDLEARRVRLHLAGTLHERVDFKVELDFAGGEVSAKDLYLGLNGLAVGTRLGHFKEPFSLEELTSSRFMTFMERSLVNALAPARNTGVRVDGALGGERGTWAAGVFRDSDGFRATPGDNYGVSGRLTYAPVLRDDSRRLLHLGISATHRRIDGDFGFGVRPGDHLAPRIASFRVPADGATTLDLELAGNVGPLGLQGEYMASWIDAVDGSEPSVEGFYAQASWLLTGETRPYSGGVFRRLAPREDFPGGPGAWEVAARYSRLDLGRTVGTGNVWNLTLGLNWYWNPHLRWLLNWELADVDALPGEAASSAHVRVAFDF